MAKLLSSWSTDVQSVPVDYVMPPEKRPGELIPISKDIPVLDFSQDQADLVEQITKACVDYGIFQVINHGVSEELMKDTIAVFKEFFNMPAEEKADLCSDGLNTKSTRLYTSSMNYANEQVHFWKDALGHPTYPLEETIKFWPEKPARYREVVAAYVAETRRLCLRILGLIGKGMGLEEEYFSGKRTGDQTLLVNHYPKCPDPSLTMGLFGHYDPNLITMLQQEVYGLQVLKDGQWLGIEPLPNAFVINTCYQLEILTNGKMKAPEHRVVTNSEADRTSIGTFIAPTREFIIEPAKEVLDDNNPPIFRAFPFQEFLGHYFMNKPPNSETALAPFKLQK